MIVLCILIAIVWSIGMTGVVYLLVGGRGDKYVSYYEKVPGSWGGHTCHIFPNIKGGYCGICGRGTNRTSNN